MTPSSLPPLVSIQQAAKFLKVSTKTLRRWEERQILLPVRTTGNHRRYSLQQLKQFKGKKYSTAPLQLSSLPSNQTQPSEPTMNTPKLDVSSEKTVIATTVPTAQPSQNVFKKNFPTESLFAKLNKFQRSPTTESVLTPVAPIIRSQQPVSPIAQVQEYTPQLLPEIKKKELQTEVSSVESKKVEKVWKSAEPRLTQFNHSSLLFPEITSFSQLKYATLLLIIVFAVVTSGLFTLQGVSKQFASHTTPVGRIASYLDSKLTQRTWSNRLLASQGSSQLKILGENTGLDFVKFNINTESSFREFAEFAKDISVGGNASVSGIVNIDSGTITTSSQSAQIFESASDISIASDIGTTTINNSLIVQGLQNDIAGVLNLSGNTLTSTGDLVIDPGGGGVSIGTAVPSNIDLAEGDFFVSGDVELNGIIYAPTANISGVATIGTVSVNGDNINDFTGTGLTVSGGALQALLGTSISSSEIDDDTILETDLNTSNSATNGYVLSYNSSTGGFTWIDLSGSNLWTDNGSITYLTSTTDDLAIGGTTSASPFFFDTSEGDLTITGNIIADSDETINGIDINAGTISDVVNLTINSGGDLTIGSIGLNDVGVSNVTSGASLIGVFDEFTNSSSTNLQAVLNDFDAAIGGGASKWTQDTGFIYLTNTTDSVTIGSGTELGKLGIDGDTDEIQLLVQGNGTQTADLAVFETSTGTDVFTISNAGNITVAGSITVNSETISDFTGNGLTLSGNALTIQLPSPTDALSSTTSSGSGLEILASGLTLLQGCSDGQVLKWNETNDSWECANDTGASFAVVNIENNDVAVGANVDTIDFSTDFSVTASPSNEANVRVADDVLNFTEFSDSLTLDAATTITNSLAGNLTIDLTSTGDFVIADSGTPFFTFTDGGALTQAGSGQVTFTGNVDASSGLDVTGASLTVGGNITLTTAGAGTFASTLTAATDETINGIDINAGTVSDVVNLTINSGGDLTIGSIGLSDAGTSNTDSGASLVGVFDEFDNSSSSTVQDVLDDIDASIGTRNFTDSLVLTDSQTVTAALDALNVAIGNRTYTENNFVTNGQSLSASIDALDIALANVSGSAFTGFSIDGDTGTAEDIDSGDTILVLGGTNGIDTVVSSTDTITINLDTTEIGTTTFGSGSGFTWTFDAGATDPTIAFASDAITIGAGTLNFGGTLDLGTNTIADGDFNGDWDFNSGTLTGITALTATTANLTTVDLGTNTITDGNFNGNWNFNSATLTGITTLTAGTANLTTVDLGTNTIADGNFNGNWAFNSGNLSGIGTITASGAITAATNETINGIDINAGTVSDVVNLTINSGGDLTIGSIGLSDAGTSNTDSGASLVGVFDEFDNSSSSTVQDVLDDIDASIGTRNFTDSLVLTDSQTVTAALDALNVAIGNRTYTENNYVTDGQSLTASIDALDQQLADVSAGSYTGWSLDGDSGDAETIGSGDTALILGGTNGIDTVVSATDTITINLDTTEIGTTTFGSGSGFTWTFDAGATDPTIAFASDAITIGAGTLNFGGTLDLGTNTIADGNFNGDWDFNSGTLTGITALTATTGNLTTLDLGTNTLTDGNLNGNWNFNSGNLSGIGTISAATNETINGIDINAGTVSDVVNLTINSGGDLTIGSIGLNDTGSNNTTSGASLVGVFDEFDNSASSTVQDVLDDIDASIGTRNFTDSLVLTDSQTVTAALDALNVAIGNRTYTEDNYVTDGQSLTASIDALDQQLADVTGSSFSSFDLSGDSGTDETINSGDVLNIVGGTNGIDTVVSATDTLTINLDTTEIGTTTFGSGSGFTWTFDAGATDPTLVFGSGSVTANVNWNFNGGLDVDDAFVIADGGVLTTSQTANFDGAVDVDGAADFSAGLTNSAGELLVSGGNVQLNDNITLTLGTGDDFSLVHNGTNTVLTSGTGDLIFDNTLATGSTIFDLGTDTSATDLLVRNNSGTQLFSINGAGAVQIGSNGQDGSLTLYNELGATDRSVTFNVSASQTQDTVYTLPPDDGGSDYVLTTDGSGVLTWQSVGGIGAGGDITAVIAGNGLTDGGTTGDVTLNVGAGNGISVASDAIAVALLSSGDGTGSNSSNSGLEFAGGSSNQLALLQGCQDDEVLAWNDSGNVWECAAVTGIGGAGDITAVGDVTSGAAFTNGGSGNSLFFNNNSEVGQLTADTLTDTRTWTLPDATGTFALLENAQTFSALQTFSAGISSTLVNSAGGSANSTTLSGTLGAFDGSDTFRGLFIDYTNADHTGSSNNFFAIDIDSITGDAQANEYAFNVGTGWDSILRYNGTEVINGSGQVIAGQITGTLFNSDSDDASPNAIARGDTLTIAGDTNGIDTSHSGDTITLSLDTTEIGTTTFGSGSGITWTFDAGATDPTIAFASDAITIGAGTLNFGGTLDLGTNTIADGDFNGDWDFNSGNLSGIGTISAATNETINGIDINAGTVSDVVNLTINSGGDLTIGSIGLSDAGTSNTDSGASLVGIFDEFDNSASSTVQDVLDDIDSAIGNRTYTEDNYVTDGQSLTASIDALDQQLADVSAGSYTGWSLDGDSGDAEAIDSGDTVLILGGTNGIDTVVSATDTITINLDTTEIGTTTFGSGSGFTWTFDAGATDPTIAFASNAITISNAATLNFGGTLDLGTNTIADGDFNGDWDFNSGTLTGITALTATTGNLTTLDLGTNTLTDGNLNGNWNFNSGNLSGIGTISAATNETINGIDISSGTVSDVVNLSINSGGDLTIGSIGLNDVGTDNITSGASLVGVFDEFDNSSSSTVQDVLDDIDASIGTRNFTDSLVLTDSQTVTAALDALNVAIGNRTYTEQNYITNAESITASLDALDQQLADVSAGSYTGWSLDGDSGDAETIGSGDTALILGGTNGIDTVVSATDTITINLDTTEIGTTTFGSGSGITWTFDAGATDPTIAFASDAITIGAGTLNFGGTLDLGTNTIADGDFNGDWDFNSGNLSGIVDLSASGAITFSDLSDGYITATSGVLGSTSTIPTTDLSGTLFSTTSDSGSSTVVQGDTVAINGGTNGIDTTLSGDTWTLNFDSTEVGTTTWGSGSGFTWTFDAGATDPSIAFASNQLTLTAASTIFSGDITVQGGDITGVSGNSIDLGEATASTIGFTAGSSLELLLDGTSLRPNTAEGNQLGSTTNEFEALYLGDNNGVFFGLDQDWSFGYDEATDDRLELTTSANSGFLTTTASTTTDAFGVIANSLTSGSALDVSSTSTSTTAITDARLGYFNWAPGSSTTVAGDLFRINIGSNGNVTNLFNVTDNGSSLFRVSESVIESSVPHVFSSPGDVSFSYDAIFTNQTTAQIESYGPLSIIAGESFESNDLTLQTFNSGDVILTNGTLGTMATFAGSTGDLTLTGDATIQGGALTLGQNGQDGSLTIYNELGGTDYSVIFQPSASQTATTTYTLPPDDGDDNYVLTTNGSGVLAWESVNGISGISGSGADGQVAYFTASGTIASDSNFLWDDAGQTFGINGTAEFGDGGSTNYAAFNTTGDLTFNGSADSIVGPATFNLLNSGSTIVNFAGAATTLNIADAAITGTIDIGGVTSDGASTINIATNGTTADTLAFGNSNASTTFALTGGDDWSIDAAGDATFEDITGTSLTVDNLNLNGNVISSTSGDIDVTPVSGSNLDIDVAGGGQVQINGGAVVIGETTISQTGVLLFDSDGQLMADGDLYLDTATTGTVHIGFSNDAKTINIGNGLLANTINLATDNNTADEINIGSALDTTAIGGTLQLTDVTSGTETNALCIDSSNNVVTCDLSSGGDLTDIVAGNYIDIQNASGPSPTIDFDPGELGSVTWNADADAGFTWTFAAGATDPTIAFASDAITIGAGTLNFGGTLDLGTNTIADGDFNGDWDFNSGTLTGITALTATTGNFTTLDLGTNTIVDGDFTGDWAFNSGALSGISTVTASSGSSTSLSLTRSSAGQWIGFNDGTDAWGLYNTAGSPEGSLTANTGALSMDTTNGTLYVKTDDGDDTGWVNLATGGSSPWTDSGTTSYLTNTTDELVLGGSSPLSSAKFSIDGDDDQIQFLIQGNGTQTSDLLVLEQSDGTDIFTINNDGDTTIEGDLDVNGAADFSAGLTNSAGELLISGGNLQLNDSINLTLGTGDDFTLVHNGTNTVLTNATGDLIFDNTLATGSTIFDLGTDTSATDFLIRNNSGTQLFSMNGAGTLQLGSNGLDGQLVLYNELGGTDYTTTFNLSGSQSQNITYTLPPNDGASNYVLVSDGSGTLTWESLNTINGVTSSSFGGTSGQIAIFNGTHSLTSESVGFGWDTATNQFSITALATATTATTQSISSFSNTLTSGGLLSATLSSLNATDSFTGNVGLLSSSRTNTAAQTLTDTGNVLDLARTTITSNASATTNVTGPILNVTNTATQTSGTLSDSSNLVAITQDADATGALLYLNTNRTGNNNTLLFEQSSGGTDILSLQDDGDLTILGDLTASGGDITGANGEAIDIGESANGSISFSESGGQSITFDLDATNPTITSSTGTISSSSIWDQNAAFDLDSNSATAFTLGDGTDTYFTFDGSTDAGDTLFSMTGTNSGITSGSILGITADTITTGAAVDVSVDGLTTGIGLNLQNAANTLTTGTLLNVGSSSTAVTGSSTGLLGYFNWEPGSSTTATGDLFRINLGANGNIGNLFNITDNGSSLFKVSESVITSALPHEFTAAGDVSIAYDLNLTNQTASLITSNGPLTIEAGEPAESNNLTLKTYNSGAVIVDSRLSLSSQRTLPDNTTPSVSNGSHFVASNGTNRVVTNFTNGTTGQIIVIETTNANLDFDCTSNSNFNCGNADLTPAAGSVITWIFDGTQWNMISYMNAGTSGGNDLAELFPSFETLETGDIVSIDPTSNVHIVKAKPGDGKSIVGIVSTAPGIVLGEYVEGVTAYPLALAGRVPVKISANSSEIKRGDFIGLSSENGKAHKVNSGYTIGRALEPWTPGSGQEQITVFVDLSYIPVDLAMNNNGQVNSSYSIVSTDTIEYAIRDLSSGQDVQQTLVLAEALIGRLNTGIIHTQKLTAQDFQVKNAQNQTVFSVNKDGNATLSGQLQANQVNTNGLSVETATVAGQLFLSDGRSIASILNENDSYLASLSAQTQQLADTFNNQQVPGTSTAFEEFLAQLTGSQDASISAALAAIQSQQNIELNEESMVLAPDAVFVKEFLSVTGFTQLSTVNVADSLSVGSGLLLTDDTIASAAETLYIQPTGTSSLNLMAGLMTLTPDGTVTVNGNLNVTGIASAQGVRTNELTPTDFSSDLSIRLASPSADVLGTATQSELTIRDASNSAVASIDASGSAKFSSVATQGIILNQPTSDATTSAQQQAEIARKQTAGQLTLPAGQTTMVVSNDNVTEESLIYLTATSNTQNQVLYVSETDTCETNVPTCQPTFTVKINQAVAQPIKFNFWIVAVK